MTGLSHTKMMLEKLDRIGAMNIVQPAAAGSWPSQKGARSGGQAPLLASYARRGIRRYADGPGEVAIRQDSI